MERRNRYFWNNCWKFNGKGLNSVTKSPPQRHLVTFGTKSFFFLIIISLLEMIQSNPLHHLSSGHCGSIFDGTRYRRQRCLAERSHHDFDFSKTSGANLSQISLWRRPGSPGTWLASSVSRTNGTMKIVNLPKVYHFDESQQTWPRNFV